MNTIFLVFCITHTIEFPELLRELGIRLCCSGCRLNHITLGILDIFLLVNYFSYYVSIRVRLL